MRYVIAAVIFIGSLIVVKALGPLLIVGTIGSGWNPSDEMAKNAIAIIDIFTLVIPLALTIWYWKKKKKTDNQSS